MLEELGRKIRRIREPCSSNVGYCRAAGYPGLHAVTSWPSSTIRTSVGAWTSLIQRRENRPQRRLTGCRRSSTSPRWPPQRVRLRHRDAAANPRGCMPHAALERRRRARLLPCLRRAGLGIRCYSFRVNGVGQFRPGRNGDEHGDRFPSVLVHADNVRPRGSDLHGSRGREPLSAETSASEPPDGYDLTAYGERETLRALTLPRVPISVSITMSPSICQSHRQLPDMPLCGRPPDHQPMSSQLPKPRKTRSRLSTSTNVVASSRPTTACALPLRIVVILSTMRKQSR